MSEKMMVLLLQAFIAVATVSAVGYVVIQFFQHIAAQLAKIAV